jgi:hypothetical protein
MVQEILAVPVEGRYLDQVEEDIGNSRGNRWTSAEEGGDEGRNEPG